MLRIRKSVALAILAAAFALAPMGVALASPMTATNAATSAHSTAPQHATIPYCIINPDTGDCRPRCSVSHNDADCDGLNAYDQGCTTDQTVLLTGTAYDWYDNNIVAGKVRLYWSNKCQSNWAVITPNSGFGSHYVKVWRGDGLSYYNNACGDTGANCASPMVFAPSLCAGSEGDFVGGSNYTNVYIANATQSGC